MKFIPIDKLKALREAAHNGDERARKILHMQMNGEDFSGLFEEHFKPVEPKSEIETQVSGVGNEDNERLQKFLDDNGISKDSPEYDSAVKEFYAEVGEKPGNTEKVEEKVEELGNEITDGEPVSGKETERDDFENIIKDLMKEESKAIDDYSKAITQVMNMPEFNEKQLKRAIARFKEIRDDETEHFNELKALLKNEDGEIEEELNEKLQ